MFQEPEYTRTVSMALSEVLAGIGVDERIVLKRRRVSLLCESMCTIFNQLSDNQTNSIYHLGSQSEGSTTIGLGSDYDFLYCRKNFNLIQDWADWEPGMINSLMIQDETVPPGYCLIQHLRNDAPLPDNNVHNEYLCEDRTGRILIKNTTVHEAVAATLAGGVRRGPSYSLEGRPGKGDTDLVMALLCKSWPLQARQWVDQQGVGQWPSAIMKRYCSSTGCFLVGVGRKGSENEELEWRISTSLAERCLMLNLNITQIRCYILMKMILKTFIKPFFVNTISSYMCKTALFHCIANTHAYVWRENNLLVCLSLCLFVLYNNILNENCPHFIIPGNNLMRGHISHEYKPSILKILQYIINSEGKALLLIECDIFGEMLQLKLNDFGRCNVSYFISGYILTTKSPLIGRHILNGLSLIRNSSSEEAIQILRRCLFKLVSIYNQSQGLGKSACYFLALHFCTTLGSVLASLNICWYNNLCAEALTWNSLGLNTDVASGKLKLASMFYCIGDSQRTEIVLRGIEESYDLNFVEPICTCCDFIHQAPRSGFIAIADNHNEEAMQYNTALCVRFLPCELNCVPHELKYEMYRSTEEDLALRSRHDEWMDWAVTDSLPYLYFLQYKTYSNLGRHYDKQRALSNLVKTIDREPNLGHRETALNLLGQCMEQEDRVVDALRCYLLSLNQRERNNAAKLHICRMFSFMVNAN